MQSAGMSDDEVRRLMQQHEDDLYRQSAALREQKESQRDAVLAKLAARKKLKEEQTREAAVTQELEQILHDQVGKIFFSSDLLFIPKINISIKTRAFAVGASTLWNMLVLNRLKMLLNSAVV